MRLIDADMLEPSEVYMNYGFTRIVYMDDIDEMPTVDPVKRGHWVHIGGDEWCCSKCGFVVTTEGSWEHPKERGYDYCYHCGAKMDEVEE